MSNCFWFLDPLCTDTRTPEQKRRDRRRAMIADIGGGILFLAFVALAIVGAIATVRWAVS